MKEPALAFLARTFLQLDPVYPRPELDRGASAGLPVHGDEAHGGGHAHHESSAAPPPGGLEPWQWAFLLALLSGSSMPLGALLGIKIRPDDAVVARWIAIGAGALLFAVAVELYGHSIHQYQHGIFGPIPMAILMVVSLVGSFFFTWVARQINGEEEDSDSEDEHEEETEPCPNCGFPNKPGSTFCNSCGTKLIADSASPQGDAPFGHGSTMSMKSISHHGSMMNLKAKGSFAHTGSTLGGSPLGAASPRLAAEGHHAKHKHKTVGALLRQMQAHERMKAKARWAHLREAMKKFHVIRFLQKEAALTRSQTVERPQSRSETAQFWDSMKNAYKDTQDAGPSEEELNEIQKQNRAAALTMLTMLIVDGVPEGILMGFMAAAGNLGITFVISLFIANFPEAFAGGAMMELGGFGRMQILGAWGGLCVGVGSLAGLSCYLLHLANPDFTGGHNVPFTIQVLVAVMEGLAGGAMISGIAACMLPEAFERRDKKAGIFMSGGFLCTFGFLLSVGIKIAFS